MSNFAAIFARTAEGWLGVEAELADVEAVDDVTDLMREAAVETLGEPVLLLVEENEDWFAVLRLDGDGDPQVYLSGTGEEGLATLIDQLSAGETTTDILSDMGLAAEELEHLGERALPEDALATVAERVGFAEELDRLRT
ncbi:hypothetical protein DPM19_13555 [Actinomadura craniellae]|uniref:tRNA adenosine deaminase n=1 Tax=Actinomadura craniellae TaxID=2231787 RepID=A0A365H7G1_9ACTN|nr:hypothetical protein DPM19_13555 [Actinomadura craniellae]